MNKNKEFIKNTAILFVGKFATQFISFLLLPLYTHYLLTDDFGSVDLIRTYITLLVPVLTLRIDTVLFRFLIDHRQNEPEKKRIISNSLFLLIIGLIFTALCYIVVFRFFRFKNLTHTFINIIVLMLSSVLLQVLRGLGKNTDYSIASIITGVVTLGANIIMIIAFHCGASSILISSTLANVICILYVVLKTRLPKYISFKVIDKTTLKEMLNYSLPMIPNSLSWWVVNVSDRTIISFFLGVSFNAIYSVSCKFSNILNNVYSIINMSWQESASLHIDDDDKDEFFTEMINSIFMAFATVSLLIIAFLPFVYNILIGEKYLDSYDYVPILLYANSWNVLIGLIGGIYIAKKRTKEIASTTIISAVINIVINLALIKFIGLYAACISTLLSYMIMSIYRYIDCQKYVKLRLNFIKIIIYTVIYIASSYIYLKGNYILYAIDAVFVVVYSVLINKKMLVMLLDSAKKKLAKLKHSEK